METKRNVEYKISKIKIHQFQELYLTDFEILPNLILNFTSEILVLIFLNVFGFF